MGENHKRLFEDFGVPTYDEWRQAAEASLKGVPFDKKLLTRTYEGIVLQPLYFSADVVHQYTLPGQPPYVRGTRVAGNTWSIIQDIPYDSPESFNVALRHDLENGQTAVQLPAVASADELETALDGVDLTTLPLFIRVGASPAAMVAVLETWMAKRGYTDLYGCIQADPLGALICGDDVDVAQVYGDIAQAMIWAADHAPNLDVVTVDSTRYHDGGGNAVQELAYAVATGVAYVRAMLERGVPIERIRVSFEYAVGVEFFMEVAKLRAARLLWSQIMEAFGQSEPSIAVRVHSDFRNKTVYDPYVNMLRTTVESLVGAVSGVDGMTIAPFDAVIRPPDEFSRRVARNQQLILRDECNLAHLIDPAGGSWYVEHLTDELAKRAWALFQEIEAAGGMLAALEGGTPQAQIAEVAQTRATNLATRRDRQVGINMYVNVQETRLPGEGVAQTPTTGQIEPVPVRRTAEPFEVLRAAADAYTERTGQRPQIFMANLGQYKLRADFTVGFYEVGGFEMLNNNGFATPEEAAEAALVSGAPVMVICSTDDAYPEIVPPLVKAVKPEMVVILAGYPQDQIETHKAAGVDAFIHIRANCYEMNRELQRQIGVLE